MTRHLILAATLLLFEVVAATGAGYHVDAIEGNDRNSGLAPENAVAMAEAFDLPWRSVADVLEKLAGAGVLAATRPGRDGHCRYIPAQSPDRLTIVSVLLALDLEGAKNLPPHPEIPAEREIRRLLDELEALWKKAESNLPMDRLAPDSSQGGKDNKKPAAGA